MCAVMNSFKASVKPIIKATLKTFLLIFSKTYLLLSQLLIYNQWERKSSVRGLICVGVLGPAVQEQQHDICFGAEREAHVGYIYAQFQFVLALLKFSLSLLSVV